MTELELKLEVAPAHKAEVLEALQLAKVAPVSHSAHYFDTVDGRLAGRGLSLRLRREGRKWVQTLKAGSDNPVRRLEDNVTVPARGQRGVPSIDLDRHKAQGARDVLEGVLKSHASDEWPALVERFQVKVSRRKRVVDTEGEPFEVAFDAGTLEANGHKRTLCEVEIEFKSGGIQHMFGLARRLVHEHHLWLSTVAKSSRGEALAFPDTPAPVAKSIDVQFDPDSRDDQQLRAMVGNCLAQILPNASHVAVGSEDSDQIHQLRVGLRRLRTILREAGALADDVDASWEGPLAEAFRQLGVHRDQESMAKTLHPRLVAAGAPEIGSWPPPVQAEVSPRATVRDPVFQATLLSIVEFSLRSGLEESAGAPRLSRKLIEKRLKKLHQKVVSAGAEFPSLPTEEQHMVRKRLKRLRYLSEFAAPLFKRGKVERYLECLRPAQDALGEHNDDAVALEGWRLHPPKEAGGWYAVGWLSARQIQTAQVCQKALKKIAKADRFWA
jgi:inorganic triphosphatase YgiF